MDGGTSSSLVDLYYGGYDEDEPLDGEGTILCIKVPFKIN